MERRTVAPGLFLSGSSSVARRIAENGTTICATTDAPTNNIVYSTNGSSWAAVASNVPAPFQIIWDGGRFVTVDSTSTQSATSTVGQSAFSAVTATTLRFIASSFGTTSVSVPMYMTYKNGTYYLSNAAQNSNPYGIWNGIVYTSTDLAAWYTYNIQGNGISSNTYISGYSYVMNANSRVFITSCNGYGKDAGIIEDNGNVPMTVGYKTPLVNPAGTMHIRIT